MYNQIYLTLNGSQFSIPNDAEFIASIWTSLPEFRSSELLVELAAHSSSAVQCAIASRRDVPAKATEILMSCDNKQVRRNLVYNDRFKVAATTDVIIAWCAEDAEFAAIAARQIMEFENADTDQLFEIFSQHIDPDVRRELAQAWQLPKHMRRRLINDSDFGVARSACEN